MRSLHAFRTFDIYRRLAKTPPLHVGAIYTRGVPCLDPGIYRHTGHQHYL
jgi:hypothetical protein